jgi:hypothetical protein
MTEELVKTVNDNTAVIKITAFLQDTDISEVHTASIILVMSKPHMKDL